MLPRSRAWIATAAVLFSSLAVAVLASRPGSPFTPPLFPGSGALPPFDWLASLLRLEHLPRDVVAVVGGAAMFAAAGAFLYALLAAWRGELSVRRVLLVGLVLHVVAVLIPLFLSRDVYSYAIYGRMVSIYGANPYTEIPAAFTGDPMYPLVSVDWIDSPSVYGPAFSAVAAGVTRAASSPAATVLGFKLVAAVASVATMLLTVAAARRLMPERTAFAAALVGWNPVVVFHGVAGGHNDALLGLAVAAAVLAVLARRELWATAALALGTLVKVSAAIPLLVALVAFVLRRPPGHRLRTAFLHAAVGIVVALPFVVPFLQTEDPTLGTLELTSRQGWLAPSRFLLVTLRGAARAIGGDVAGDVAALVVRVAFPAVFAWVLVALLRHVARGPGRIEPSLIVGAMAWASLISLMISPILLPWYMAWLIPLAWVLPQPARGGAVLVSVALAITELVAEPSRSPGVYEAMVFGLHWVATPIVLLVLIRLLLALRRRLAEGPAAGLLDPLLVEEAGISAALSGSSRLPVGAGAPAGPGGGQVADGAQHQHDHRGDQGSRAGAQPIREERGQHRHGDPH